MKNKREGYITIRVEDLVIQPDGRYTIVFKNEQGKLVAKPNCSWCFSSEAHFFDEEDFTIHFERVVPYDDLAEVYNEYYSEEDK